MSQFETLARPYAKAVFELAQAEGTLNQWSQMLALAKDIATNPDMMQLLRNPHFHNQDVVALWFDIARENFTPEMKNLCQTLADFGRLSLMPALFALYDEMRKRAQKTISVELTSALPLDDNYQQQFRDALKRKTDCDIQLSCAVDARILGGAIIRAGDILIDGSVRGRLNKLSDAIGIL